MSNNSDNNVTNVTNVQNVSNVTNVQNVFDFSFLLNNDSKLLDKINEFRWPHEESIAVNLNDLTEIQKKILRYHPKFAKRSSYLRAKILNEFNYTGNYLDLGIMERTEILEIILYRGDRDYFRENSLAIIKDFYDPDALLIACLSSDISKDKVLFFTQNIYSNVKSKNFSFILGVLDDIIPYLEEGVDDFDCDSAVCAAFVGNLRTIQLLKHDLVFYENALSEAILLSKRLSGFVTDYLVELDKIACKSSKEIGPLLRKLDMEEKIQRDL